MVEINVHVVDQLHPAIKVMVERWIGYDYTREECAVGLLEPRINAALRGEFGCTDADFETAIRLLKNAKYRIVDDDA